MSPPQVQAVRSLKFVSDSKPNLRELRLVPVAVVSWLALIALLTTRNVLPAAALIVVAAIVLLLFRHWGQAILTAGISGVLLVAADVQRRVAERFEPPDVLHGQVASAPGETSSGSVLVNVHVAGYPKPLPVFTEQPSAVELVTGTPVVVDATVSDGGRAGLGLLVAEGEVAALGEPAGWAKVAAHVRTTFNEAVGTTLGGEHRGLIPGMTLGDTSLQSSAAEDLYLVTGLSHLSAVSGANVTIVTTAAVILCRAATLGPRVQVAAAVTALVAYVGLVGTEPSVLRAGVTGLVGLIAVISSSRMEPIHALGLAIVVLLALQPQLAVQFGFALSVAATAGIVALSPIFAEPLARTGLPPIFARAVAVAIAADVVTMPIISLMTGKVSLVSVLANILVAPAAAPVTILGLIATALSLLPGALAVPVLWAVTPFTWWIHVVAEVCAALPVVLVTAAPITVLLCYGWVVAGIVCRKVLLTVSILALGGVWAWGPSIPVQEVDLEGFAVLTVETEEEVSRAPPGTQVIVVLDPSGSPADRPTVTTDGVPVLYPHRDGDVRLLVDGTQRAADSRF